jgi:hypothetical protein
VGVYALSPQGTVTITRTDTGLLAEATGLGRTPLYAASESEFFVKVLPIRLTWSTGRTSPTPAWTGSATNPPSTFDPTLRELVALAEAGGQRGAAHGPPRAPTVTIRLPAWARSGSSAWSSGWS